MSKLDEVLREAVNDLSEHGYTSSGQVNTWLTQIRAAMSASMLKKADQMRQMESTLKRFFKKSLSQADIRQRHEGIPRFTIERVMPSLRDVLAQKIRISADLIVLNREASMEKTLQRFAGWASSMPAGGGVANKTDVKAEVKKSLQQLTFVERRVAIDQGHKLMAAVDDVIATQTGAIAKMWHSEWRMKNYDYRPDHKALDGKAFAVEGSWAVEKGLINKGDGYAQDIVQPAQEPFCQCYWQSLYHLRDLPDSMLTKKGREALAKAKAA